MSSGTERRTDDMKILNIGISSITEKRDRGTEANTKNGKGDDGDV